MQWVVLALIFLELLAAVAYYAVAHMPQLSSVVIFFSIVAGVTIVLVPLIWNLWKLVTRRGA